MRPMMREESGWGTLILTFPHPHSLYNARITLPSTHRIDPNIEARR